MISFIILTNNRKDLEEIRKALKVEKVPQAQCIKLIDFKAELLSYMGSEESYIYILGQKNEDLVEEIKKKDESIPVYLYGEKEQSRHAELFEGFIDLVYFENCAERPHIYLIEFLKNKLQELQEKEKKGT